MKKMITWYRKYQHKKRIFSNVISLKTSAFASFCALFGPLVMLLLGFFMFFHLNLVEEETLKLLLVLLFLLVGIIIYYFIYGKILLKKHEHLNKSDTMFVLIPEMILIITVVLIISIIFIVNVGIGVE